MSVARTLFALALLGAACPAAAAPMAPPRPGPFVLTHATVHVGDGRVLEDATLGIADGVIRSLGRAAATTGRGTVIDCTGLHVAPGFTAADSVLGLVEISAVRATRDDTEVGTLNPHVRAWSAFNPDSELLPVAMANGVLHAVVAPRGGSVPGQSAVMMLSGWTREDMVLEGPAALNVTWPSLRLDRGADPKKPLAEQERERAESVEEITDLFARARTYRDAREAPVEGGRRQRRERPVASPPVQDLRLEALARALDGDLPVVVQANTVPQIRAALAWAREESLRLVIAGGRDAWRIADEIAAAAVPVIIGEVRALPAHDHDPYDAAYANPVVLWKAGVKIRFTVGNDAFSAAHVRNLPDEAAAAIPFGLPPEEALEAITLAPAEVFGVDDRIGSIELGKMANLVVWDGPPMEIESRVQHVFVRGEEIPIADRHTRLYRTYRARPAPAEVTAPARAPR